MLPHTLKQNNPRSQYIRNIKEMEKIKNIEKWKTLGSEYLRLKEFRWRKAERILFMCRKETTFIRF